MRRRAQRAGPADPQGPLRPLKSLLRKSEKAKRNLKPGTWQHGRMASNVQALRIAVALLAGRRAVRADLAELHEALRALAAMRRTASKAKAGFAAGTPQHSLQRDRLAALRLAERRLKADVSARGRHVRRPATPR